YLFFSTISGPKDQKPIVEKESPTPETPKDKPDTRPEQPKNDGTKDDPNQNKKQEPNQDEPAQKAARPYLYALADLPGKLVIRGLQQLNKAPHLYALSDLPSRPDLAKRLAADLYRTDAVELVVLTSNPSNAAGDLEKVLAKKDVKVLMDKKTRNHIKK